MDRKDVRKSLFCYMLIIKYMQLIFIYDAYI
ncbi:hypothetical protein EMIT0357P_20011 [Pseudomonas marginalis]